MPIGNTMNPSKSYKKSTYSLLNRCFSYIISNGLKKHLTHQIKCISFLFKNFRSFRQQYSIIKIFCNRFFNFYHNNIYFNKLVVFSRFILVIMIPYQIDTFDCQVLSFSVHFYLLKMEGGGPMEGILNGVFNYAHSNFSPCGRNYKSHQKEVNFFIKNLRSTYSTLNGCFSENHY